MNHLSLVLTLSLALAGAAPAADNPAAAATDILRPNANLVVQNIPPVPAKLAAEVARYNDFRGHGLVAWHPTRREMLVSHRKAGASTSQLFRLSKPMGELEQLTDAPDPVGNASYEPNKGEYLVFSRASGGNEVSQLYRLDLSSRQVTLLSHPDERHAMGPWLKKSGKLLFSSVPLDRTAKGGTRAEVTTTISMLDPLKPGERTKLAELAGGGWGISDVSPDEQWITLNQYISANESALWLLNVKTGQQRQLLPLADDQARAVHMGGGFSKDGKSLMLVSDRFGEFHELVKLTLSNGKLERITSHIPWDVNGGSRSEDGKLLAVQSNVDGRSELRLFNATSLKELPAPRLPAGSIGGAQFSRKAGELGFMVNSAQGPSQIYSMNPKTGQVEQWTQAYAPEGINTAEFRDQQIIRWPSFDGRTISGLMTLPPARFSGKRPVIISIHGGPEGQSTMGFLGRNNYFTQELGIAFIQPNVRGSTGYGKTFLAMDNGFKREDSVKDIGALLDWIKTQPNLDADRVLVMGGSYGGYMTLAVSTHYADRIAGAIDIVGISHFVTFLNNTESYRRDLRRVEYGDEREPEMRAFLDRISPLTNAAKITKPLFVVQGKNDPRVPYTEAEQIVERVRANGTPVWYLRAENEGHGFARKENADYQLFATILFLQQTLLK